MLLMMCDAIFCWWNANSYNHFRELFGNKHIHDPKGCALEQGSANIFYKGTGNKYFRLCGPRGKIKDI